ncbi:MAG: hypothetical protein L6R28_21710 [Planctomycetes bacterium]|nr:hypothetical protein [Planctomycetota bacterium]
MTFPQALLLAQFLLSSGVMVYAASKLADLADVISDRLGLSKGFIGMVLVGWATSLPELAITISSVSLVGQPELAFGNLFGSNAFNLGILAFIDLLHRPSVWGDASKKMAVGVLFSIAIVLAASAGVAWYEVAWTIPVLGIGWASAIILVLYFGSTYVIYRLEHSPNGVVPVSLEAAEPAGEPPPARSAPLRSMRTSSLLGLTMFCCAVVVADGYWLSALCDRAADAFNLGRSFVGTAFLATVSSLPEMVSVCACFRLRQVDMAVGAIFGSNIFNMGILAAGDLCYTDGSLFFTAGRSAAKHLTTVAFTVGMSLIALAALWVQVPSPAMPVRYPLRRKIGSLAIFALYASTMVFAYTGDRPEPEPLPAAQPASDSL